ncbi:DUF202 domain-containing protein [uncultured Marinobacter sp.]|uniref:YidH family protein n=1 Tax=uncultured Marinobacter sp. TaxID=187379 RepID=UPI0030D862D7|tara:strand:- start:82 stop:450 length:369 start_codon:yes stop_codon:yes gene_type:complete
MSDLNDPRVLFAAERTLLAWNRTSLVLITFGFMVERANILLHVLAPEQAGSFKDSVTFWLGIAFIALGAFSAFYSSKQYWVVLKTLTPAEFPKGYRVTWGLTINLIIAVLGLVLAVALVIGQ